MSKPDSIPTTRALRDASAHPAQVQHDSSDLARAVARIADGDTPCTSGQADEDIRVLAAAVRELQKRKR